MKRVTKDDLLNLHRQLGETEARIIEFRRKESEEKKKLRRKVEEANAMLDTLIAQELLERHLVWCTMCSTLVENSILSLVSTQERRRVTDDPPIYEGFEQLHSACAGCHERAFDRHGTIGEYDWSARDQAAYFAFRVEERGDGFYARRFGVWTKLSDSVVRPTMTAKVRESLIREFELPPPCAIQQVGEKGHVKLVFFRGRASVVEPLTVSIAGQPIGTA